MRRHCVGNLKNYYQNDCGWNSEARPDKNMGPTDCSQQFSNPLSTLHVIPCALHIVCEIQGTTCAIQSTT